MKRITVLVSGKVQEVGYREKVVTIAKNFMLTGMVQNLEDGRVRIIAEGKEDKLQSFIDAINIKNTMILVENMDIAYSNATGDYADFYKLVGVGETDSRLDTASKYLKELIGVVKEFKEESSRKQDTMIDKQNQMLDKQNQMLEKQDIMIEQQNENTNILREFKEESNRKQDIMIEKQDIMIEKQDIMIEKQNENTNILKEFKEESNRKQDIMIDKQNQMLEKQTETISAIQNESKLIREEIGGEVNLFNVDSRDHMELNYRDIKKETKEIKEETKEIKEDIRDVKEEIKNIKISLKK